MSVDRLNIQRQRETEENACVLVVEEKILNKILTTIVACPTVPICVTRHAIPKIVYVIA